MKPTREPLGALILIAGLSILPLMDASAKHLATLGYAPLLVAWARFSLAAAVLAPLMLSAKRRSDITRGGGLKWQIIRGTMLAGATVCFYSGLLTLPLADALGVYFIYPLLITLLAPLMLGEHVGWRRYLCVIIGFVGCLIIVRPGFQEVPVGVLYVLAGGVFYALFNVFTRKLTDISDPWNTVFMQSVVGTIVLAVFVPFVWQMPAPDAWPFLGLMIFAAIVAHWMIVCAYDFAPASFLAPFGYFEIVSGTVIGFLWFGDFPDHVTLFGIAIIIASGVYIALRGRGRTTPPSQL